MPSHPEYREWTAAGRGRTRPLMAPLVLVLGLCAGLAGLLLLMYVVQERYEGRIYPNVRVLGLDLSGLTLEQARVPLSQVADRAQVDMLVLTDGEKRWEMSWFEAGKQLDVERTLDVAYAVGHSPGDRHWRRWPRVWRSHHDVAPAFALNLGSAQAMLERLAPAVARPAGQTSLRLEGEQLVFVEGESGRELDVEASLEALIVAYQRRDGGSVPLAFKEVPQRDLDVAPLEATLERLASYVARSPGEPSLRLEGDRVMLVEGQPGRELDVEATLRALVVAQEGGDGESVALVFRPVLPSKLDMAPLQAQVDDLVMPRIDVATYDVVRDRSFSWTLGRAEIAACLRLEPGEEEQTYAVELDRRAVVATLQALAAQVGEGCGFRLEEATDAIIAAHEQGGGVVTLYLTHAPRTYTVRPGDTAAKIATRHGMPLWMLTQANPEVDLGLLRVGQQVVIPTQDALTPYLPVLGKRIVIDLSEQRMRVYEKGGLLHGWIVSTGRKGSPTYTGVFQILVKEENAYASQWDLQMPHFLGIYAAGPDSMNGIHALPILSSGARLWEGNLGSPVSYGCIVIGVQEAETLYAWGDVGVVVVIKE